jgi:hypothetical protein
LTGRQRVRAYAGSQIRGPAVKYSILIYGSEAENDRLPRDVHEDRLAGHRRLQAALAKHGPYTSVQLMPTSSAVTVRARAPSEDAQPIVTDGPFAETKEQFLGFYVAEFASLEEAMALAQEISAPGISLELRPVSWIGGGLPVGA